MAGTILALIVWMPALFIPGFLNRPQQGLISWWIFLPALGAAFSSQLIFANLNIWKRIQTGLFGFACGCCCYLAAFYWTSGSPHTSVLEIIVITPLGGVLILFLLKLWQKLRNPAASKIAAEKSKMIWNRVHRKTFSPILFLILLAGFTVMTIRNLSIIAQAQKISPASKSATLSFFDRFGYWPAALLTPCVGLIFICYCAWLNHRNSKNTL